MLCDMLAISKNLLSLFRDVIMCYYSTDLNLSEIRQNEIKKALVTKQVRRFDAVFPTSGQVSFM